VGNVSVVVKASVRNIGAQLDERLCLDEQVAAVCRTSYAQLKNLARIKKNFDRKSLEKLIHAFITSRLDFCNSLYFAAKNHSLSKLQILQNSCARLLVNLNRYAHVTPILNQLHWLPVKQRIVFKILVITYKCIHDVEFPSYLRDFITLNAQDRPTRTANSCTVTVPFTRSSFVKDSAFNHFAPTLWNNLPVHLRLSSSLPVFKSRLKTHLFQCF
jgi:hypothetical protein